VHADAEIEASDDSGNAAGPETETKGDSQGEN